MMSDKIDMQILRSAPLEEMYQLSKGSRVLYKNVSMVETSPFHTENNRRSRGSPILRLCILTQN